MYGFDDLRGYDLNDYIKYNIVNNKFKKIYEQKKEQGTGFSSVASSLTSNNIPQFSSNAKCDISVRYNMQNGNKNT